jgi:hypothetical protein
VFGVGRRALVTEAQTSTVTSDTHVFERSWVARVRSEVFTGVTRVRLFIGQPALVTEAQVSTLTSGTHVSWVARVRA